MLDCLDFVMDKLDKYSDIFKALSDPMRLRLLEMLPSSNDKRSFCVCELANMLGLSQPCLSYHLNILKTFGLIGYEKDCCSVFYFVQDEHIKSLLDQFKEQLSQR